LAHSTTIAKSSAFHAEVEGAAPSCATKDSIFEYGIKLRCGILTITLLFDSKEGGLKPPISTKLYKMKTISIKGSPKLAEFIETQLKLKRERRKEIVRRFKSGELKN
jgi:hypothetical protein